jgi:hypothetical protein
MNRFYLYFKRKHILKESKSGCCLTKLKLYKSTPYPLNKLSIPSIVNNNNSSFKKKDKSLYK